MQTPRVRIYYPFFPYPPHEGSYLVVFDQIRAFSSLGFSVELVYWIEDGKGSAENQKKAVGAFPEAFPENVKIVFLPKQSGAPHKGGSAKLHGASGVRRVIDQVFRVCRSFASELSSPELLFYPPKVFAQISEPVDLALYNYSFSYSWMRYPNAVEKKRIAVFHNLESDLFFERQKGSKWKALSWIHAKNAEKLRNHEKKLASLADELWFISPEDQAKFERENPALLRSKSRFVPPGYSSQFRLERTKKFTQREISGVSPVLGFIGALDFHPNQVGVNWLIQELAPRLQKRGFQGELRIAGRGADQEFLSRASRFPFIKVLGFVSDLESYWASLDISLVPHFQGSGVRIKLLEALATGVPTLATSGAISRVHPKLAKSIYLQVSDRADAWCDYIMSDKWLDFRKKNESLPLPVELDSCQIYSFAKEWIQKE